MNASHTTSRRTDPAQILRARARALAQPLADAAPSATLLELLEFGLGRERYAVETGHVREVYPVKNLTPLPSAPAIVLGVANVRGRIVPVYDLKRILNLPEHGLTDFHHIIVIEGGGMELGLLIDATVAVASRSRDDLQASLPTLTGIRREYLTGITADGLVVLDVPRILSDPAIIVHEAVAS